MRSYNTLYVASHAVTIIALIGILISIPSYAYTLGDHQEGVNSATRYTSSPTSLLTQSAILSSPVPMQSGGGLRHPQNDLLPISTTSQVSSSIPPANYDEQLGTTFTQNFASITYNVTAVAQSDTNGYGPAYLLNGLGSTGYWYQVGISYDWPFTAGGYNPGFGMNYEVFDSQGASVFPSFGGGLSSIQVNPGDIVLLNLYFSGRNVVMLARDWNTGSSASQTFSAARATSFVGLTSGFANQNGFFTGLMTEWYHVDAYYGNEEESTFSNYSHSLPSAWLWADEFNVATSQLTFSDASKTPLAFLSSPSQLQPFYSHGAYEAVDAYEFVSGFQPPPVQVSRPILRTVSVDVGQIASFTCNATGGILPFTYSWTFGDGSVATGQNVTHTFSLPGTVDVQCTVIDSLQTTSQNATSILVLSDPSINLLTANPTSVDLGQTVTLAVEATGGSTDYTYEWMNLPPGCNSENTASISCQPTTTGIFEVAVNITDSNGFTLISSNLSVSLYPDPSLASFTASPSSLDEGQTIEFAASPSGGVGDLSLVYYNLPTGCESVNSTNLACSPAAAGTYQVTVTVTDSNGFTISSSPVMITVNPDPTANIIASPPSIDLGQTLAVTLLVHGGTGPFSYSFTMLPPGCGTSTSPELSCTPSALGNYTVEGFVSDATGQTSIGYLSVTVNSVIRISTFTTSPESVDLGEEVTLAVSTTGGAGPLTYSYSDLPTGCLSADSPTLHCTPSTSGTYLVKATVTDHAGKNATSSLNITVLPARVIGPSLNQEELLVGGIITSLIAISLVTMVLSKRRRGP